MTKDYGIKVSKPGVDVNSANPHELVFSSKYKTLRIHSRGSGSISSASGGGLVTIPHGLDYVPAFLVHVDNASTGSYCIAPFANSSKQLLHAYADDTNLYIKATADVNTYNFYSGSESKNYAWEYSGGYYTDAMYTGEGSVFGNLNGAYRVEDVTLANSQSNITSAKLKFYVTTRTGSGLIQTLIRGIDEDNTAKFDSGTAVFARGRTTASLNSNTNLSTGAYANEDVKSIVEEIISRPGWSSGNAMAFTLDDNGTSAGNDYYDNYVSANTYLEVITTIATTADYKYTIFLNQLE